MLFPWSEHAIRTLSISSIAFGVLLFTYQVSMLKWLLVHWESANGDIVRWRKVSIMSLPATSLVTVGNIIGQLICCTNCYEDYEQRATESGGLTQEQFLVLLAFESYLTRIDTGPKLDIVLTLLATSEPLRSLDKEFGIKYVQSRRPFMALISPAKKIYLANMR